MIVFSGVLYKEDEWFDIDLCEKFKHKMNVYYNGIIYPNHEGSPEIFSGKIFDLFGESFLSNIRINKTEMSFEQTRSNCSYTTSFLCQYDKNKGFWVGEFMGVPIGHGQVICIMPKKSYALLR